MIYQERSCSLEKERYNGYDLAKVELLEASELIWQPELIEMCIAILKRARAPATQFSAG